MQVELKSKLEDLDKNLKYWIKQGFRDFDVYIEDYKAKISFKIEEKKVESIH